MINENTTFALYDYYPSELRPNSVKKIIATCNKCDKVRETTKNAYRDLCRSCSRGGRAIVKCDNCGKKIEKDPSAVRKNNFCNYKCKGEWESENKRDKNHPCFGRHHTDESKQLIRENIPSRYGENNSNYRGGKIKINCDNCGKEIERNPANIHNYNFCNMKCYGEWMSRNEGWRRKHKTSCQNRIFNFKKCITCGEEFIPTSANQKYCKDCKPEDWRDWDNAIYLNKNIKGFDRHHITNNIVICIPHEIHNFIDHCLKTHYGMMEINKLAIQFLLGRY